jgi:hypothetical protein
MSDLTVNIQTPSGFEVQGALIPDNITVQQVIAELLGGLSLPRAANGQPINYSLVLVNRGLVLQGDQTLQDGGVQYGDTIRLVTAVEPANGSQAGRGADQNSRNGGSSVADPLWHAAPARQNGQAVAPPVVAPALPAPVVNNDRRDAASVSTNEWSRNGPVVNNDWPLNAAPVVDSDWPRNAAPVVDNDWPRNAAPAATTDWPREAVAAPANDWPLEAEASPMFESLEDDLRSLAMEDPRKTDIDESRESGLALTHIEIDGGWTAKELSEWLARLELAYSRLNAFLCLSDEDIMGAAPVADGKSGSGSLEAAFSLLVASGNRRSSSLRVSRIDFEAAGTIELIGEQPPIKIMAEMINGWRQKHLAANGSRSDPADAAAAVVRRAEQLSSQGRGVFVEGFIHHAIDSAREALEGMAKDIRIKKVSWSSGGSNSGSRL